MADHQLSQDQTPIPENLKKLLNEYRRKLWRAKIAEAFFAGVIGLVFSFLLVFALDRFFQTPAVVRLIILLTGTSIFAVFAPYWMRRWVWGHRRENDLARLIALKHPDLGDRLLGIIELQGQSEEKESMSPRLRSAAMEHVAEEAERKGLTSALPRTWIGRAVAAAVVLCAGAVCAFLLTPKAGLNSLKRWAMPLTDTERYTFTTLENVPHSLVVPHGEAFDLTLRLASDSERKPSSGEVRFGANTPVTAALTNGAYVFSLPAQHAPANLLVAVGDARHSIRIEPTLRPAIQVASADLTYPEYLQLPKETLDLKSGVATAVEGSTLTFNLLASRGLSKASLGPIAHIPNPELAKAADTPKPGFTAELSVKDNTATSTSVQVANSSFDVPFSWTDVYSLKGDNSFRIRVEAIKDIAPSAYIQGIEKQKVLLPEETLDFEVLAEDDFGLSEIGLEWNGEASPSAPSSALAKGEMKLLPGSPTSRRLNKPTAFCPATLNIAPQKLILRAYTKDYLPGRPVVYSEPIVLFILTRDEHAQMLKNQFDRIVGELEDAARREQNANEENQRLERMKPEDLQKDENRKRIEAQQKAEQENTQRIDDLHKRMEQLMKDSARNGDIDKETMQKMAESMKSLGELAEKDMPQVDQKLGDAQQNNSTPEQTKKDVEKAVEEQKKVIEKMKKTLEKAREANKDMEASTFVNRLKKAASEQDSITNTLIESSTKATGMASSSVDPSVLTVLTDLDRKQAMNASDIRWIEEDLGHFFTRTNKPVYQEILKEMRDSSKTPAIDSSLEEIREMMRNNYTFRSANTSDYWAKRLKEWAKKLDGEKDDQAGGGGGGGGGNPEDEDFEFMLRVMKMIQQEQDIRARTRALEELKRSIELKP